MNGPPTAEHFLRAREVLSKVAGVGGVSKEKEYKLSRMGRKD